MIEPIVAVRYMLDGVVTTVAANGAGSLQGQPRHDSWYLFASPQPQHRSEYRSLAVMRNAQTA
jgi:hypothetical protein